MAQTQVETILIQTGAIPAMVNRFPSVFASLTFEISNQYVKVIIMYNTAIENIKWK